MWNRVRLARRRCSSSNLARCLSQNKSGLSNLDEANFCAMFMKKEEFAGLGNDWAGDAGTVGGASLLVKKERWRALYLPVTLGRLGGHGL